jgi:dephospho-CoA kinase
MSSPNADRRTRRVPVVGVVGGVGSGKSSVVLEIAGLKLFVVDADRIGHRLLAEAAVRDELTAAFGTGILDARGRVNRRALAALVFGEGSMKAVNLQRLNGILHPRIRQKITNRLRSFPAGTDAVILDAALLLEAGWRETCDAIIFIDTPLKLRRDRVLQTRAWTSAELAAREAAQWSLSRKRAAADHVVDNSGLIADSARQLEEILRGIILRSADH